MNVEQVQDVINQCHYPEYSFSAILDSRGGMYLQGAYGEQDVITGKYETQFTRRWFLNPEMVKSEIVQTVFKCVMTSMEHRVREWFRYRDRAIFGPHFDVDSLHAICTDEHLDYRGRILTAKEGERERKRR